MSDDPHNNFCAASEFADKVLNAYLIVGAMNHHGMHGEPTVDKYDGLSNDPEGKKQHVHAVIRSFIEQHVINQIPEMSMSAPISNNLTCRFCKKEYAQVPALRKHEEKKHGFKPTVSETADKVPIEGSDKVYNYTHQVLILLLLRLNHNDAISLGDSERIIRLYKFFCLYFKVSNCPKYAIATLQLLPKSTVYSAFALHIPLRGTVLLTIEVMQTQTFQWICLLNMTTRHSRMTFTVSEVKLLTKA